MGRNISRSQSAWGIYLTLGLFVMLAVIYSLEIPIAEATDETEHVTYALFMRDNLRIPVATIVSKDDADMDIVIHPPLYYGLSLPLVLGIDTNDFYQVIKPNRRFSFRDTIPNIFLHFGQERFPFQGTVRAFHLLRLGSVIWGAIAVYAMYRVGLFLWPNDGLLALLGAALFAFNPSFLFMAATVHNDVAVTALYGLGIWWSLSFINQEAISWKFELLGGLIVGLVALTKVSGLGLYAIYAIAFTLRAWQKKSWNELLKPLTVTLLMGGAIAGWWYLHNWRHYGDPLAWQLNQVRFAEMMRVAPYTWYDFVVFLDSIASTSWGAFGYTHLKTSYWIYSLVWGFLWLAGLGLVYRQARLISDHKKKQAVILLGVLVISLLVMGLAFEAVFLQ